MTPNRRPATMRWIGTGAAIVIALSLALAPRIGLPTVSALPTSMVAVLDDGSPRAPATSVACPDDHAGDPAEIGTAVDVDGIEILLEGTDASLGSNSLTAAVDGKEGDPLSGALVYLTIRMPTMDHGTSAYPAAEVEPGRYRAEDVSLGMGGEWLVTVKVIRQARAPISAAYVVAIAE